MKKKKNKTGVTLYNLSAYLMKVAFKIFKIVMKVKCDHSIARNLIKQYVLHVGAVLRKKDRVIERDPSTSIKIFLVY